MDEGLRERKKRETRAAISRIATTLFYERGFDDVTVDDVARAAGVSKMTVFNYFARKEDLMFDREQEGIALLRAVLAGRGRKNALIVLRAEVRRLVAAKNVFTKFDHGVLGFWKVVEGSPALRARLRELADEARDALSPHFEGPNADLVAGLVVAGWRAAYRAGLDAARRGKSPQKAAADLERVLDATMAAAHAAMRASGRRRIRNHSTNRMRRCGRAVGGGYGTTPRTVDGGLEDPNRASVRLVRLSRASRGGQRRTTHRPVSAYVVERRSRPGALALSMLIALETCCDPSSALCAGDSTKCDAYCKVCTSS